MRKVVVSTYVSLDGVIQMDGGWHFPYFDDDARKYATQLLMASDALVMGRLTYEAFATTWPTAHDDFGDRINAMSKYVASTTLDDPEWNNTTVIEGDVVDAVRDLKGQPGQNILLYGTGSVARELMKHDLVDEHHLWVHPVIVGEGTRLFVDGFDPAAFELINAHTLGSGVAILSYRP
jgi:dihydrofolate reductase